MAKLTDPDAWYIATEPLYAGHIRAANEGDRVHGSTVVNNGWEDKVVREGTKAAEKASGES